MYIWGLLSPQDPELTFQALVEGKESKDGTPHPKSHYAFARSLIDGTLAHLEAIDEHIRKHARNWAFERIAKVDLAILRIAIFELLYSQDTPPVVVINEAVNLAKTFSDADSKRFVNGILDKIKEQTQRHWRTRPEHGGTPSGSQPAP
jgi:N utilization substance protein B